VSDVVTVSVHQAQVVEDVVREEPQLWERITLIEGEATSFDLGRTFPAAFLSGSFDHLLDDEERLSALRNIGRHLSDGGVLVFDVFLGLMKGTPLSPAGVVQAGGREIRRLVGGRMPSDQRKETTLVFEVYEKGELVERIEERRVSVPVSAPACLSLLMALMAQMARMARRV
jgi:SAM-dependent methyltransferase